MSKREYPVTVKNGSATGRCDILAAINDAANAGHCTFESGTGRLTSDTFG